MSAATEPFAPAHAAFVRAHKTAPAWLAATRAEGLASYLATGLPSRRHEEWKYTSLRAVAEAELEDASTAAAHRADPARLAALIDTSPEEATLVFVDGVLSTAHSRLGTLPAGVSVKPLAEALANEATAPALIATLTASPAAWSDHPFVALSQAFLETGTVIDLAKGVTLDRPLHLLHVTTAPRAAHFPRVVVRLAPQSSAHVVESHVGGAEEGPYLVGSRTDLVVGEGAALTHVKSQHESKAGLHIGLVYVRLARDARLYTLSHAQGGRLIRNDLFADLDGQGAELTLDGLYLMRGNEHIDNHTVVDHKVPNAKSEQLYKGVLRDASRAVFNGKVLVRKDAQQTVAHQLNRNLMLSREAEVDTKPELLIDADDVKCSHGAAVGQLRPDEIFYLQSRGLDRARAIGLLSTAYADEVLLKLGAAQASVQQRLRRLTKEWFTP